MPISDEEAKEWPRKIMIGTKNAYKNNKFYTYTKTTINGEPVYVCDRGSNYKHGTEILMLRYDRSDNGTVIWTAYDTYLDSQTNTVNCRQAVFRAVDQDILQAGCHKWQTNEQADPYNSGLEDDWQGQLQCETRVFTL